MTRCLLVLFLAACAHSGPVVTATNAPPARVARVAKSSPDVCPASPTVLHTLTPGEGIAVRGALTELNGGLYGLAGEAGPNSSDACSSSANWQTIEHTAHCPGSLFSLALDGTGFQVEHAFSRLDDQTRTNLDGYHPYGTLAVGPDHRLYGVTQAGGAAAGRDPRASRHRGQRRHPHAELTTRSARPPPRGWEHRTRGCCHRSSALR